MCFLLTGCGRPAENPLANVTERTTAVLKIAAPETDGVTANPNPVDFRSLYNSENQTIPLEAEGETCGTDSIGLYEQPDPASRKLMVLPAGVKLRVIGVTVTGELYEQENRWLRVRTSGSEGYIPAASAAVQCSTAYDALHTKQRAALGIMMYYQSMQLYQQFYCKGGTIASGGSGEFDSDGYERLLPEGLTVKQLRTAFHLYFSDSFPETLEDLYRQKDGSLWVLNGSGNHSVLDYTEIYMLTAQGSERLIYDTRAHYQPGDTQGGSEWIYYPFSLVYENGYWKTAEMTELY